MTYNFDPDRWYDDQRLRLDLQRRNGELSEADYPAALAELDRRYDQMVKRLDGTFELHKTVVPQP
ncbi:MAG: hypothetical protein EHM24_22500 [Acidobacteria bacterium]|nr:MAG: hypothetical protein EHM24_22500 [Acidobacteriota bacterium]